MTTFIEVLPLAITMMAGPQIISAVLLITGKHPKTSSLAFVAAVALTASIGTLGLLGIANSLGIESKAPDSQPSSIVVFVQTALIGLLIVMAIKTYLTRSTTEKPKWMGTLQKAGPGESFRLGMTLIATMPSDIVIMITVAVHLAAAGAPFVDALPFIFTTALIAALPLIVFVIFQRRAATAMPKVRQWMDGNSWLIQIAVCLIFIFLLWK